MVPSLLALAAEINLERLLPRGVDDIRRALGGAGVDTEALADAPKSDHEPALHGQGHTSPPRAPYAVSAASSARLGNCRADACGAVLEDQVAVRNDHALDREVAEGVECWKQPVRIGLVDEDVQPVSPVPLRTSPLTSVACSRMKNMTCCGSPSSSIASTPRGSSPVVAGFGNLPPGGFRRSPHRRAVALDEVDGAAIVGTLGEQHAHRFAVRVEVVAGGEGTGRSARPRRPSLADDRDLLGPVLSRLPVGVGREPPGQLSHGGRRRVEGRLAGFHFSSTESERDATESSPTRSPGNGVLGWVGGFSRVRSCIPALVVEK